MTVSDQHHLHQTCSFTEPVNLNCFCPSPGLLRGISDWCIHLCLPLANLRALGNNQTCNMRETVFIFHDLPKECIVTAL